MRYKLVIFDWDGTLLDSIGSIVSCTLAATAEIGLATPDEARIRGAIGLSIRDMVDAYAPGASDETFEQIAQVYRRHWLATYGHRSRLFDGAAEALAELEARGHRLAIATGRRRPGLEVDFERTAVGHRFHATRTVTESPSKPDPTMLHEILAELRLAPHEAVMVGDTVHDLEMARRAGCDAVAVTCGSQGEADLLAYKPRASLPSVAALPAWLAGAHTRE